MTSTLLGHSRARRAIAVSMLTGHVAFEEWLLSPRSLEGLGQMHCGHAVVIHSGKMIRHQTQDRGP